MVRINVMVTKCFMVRKHFMSEISFMVGENVQASALIRMNIL